MSDILNSIINFKSFSRVFRNMMSVDSDTTINIFSSMELTVRDYHNIMNNKESSKERLLIAVLSEIIDIQNHSKQYLSIIEGNEKLRNRLNANILIINNNFFEEFYKQLDNFLELKRAEMYKEIKEKISWHTGMTDVAKKSSGIVNKGSSSLKSITRKLTQKEIEIKEIDERTLMEKIIESHLNKNIIQDEVTKILKHCTDNFKSKWEHEINTAIPELLDLHEVDIVNNLSQKGISVGLDASGQVVVMGAGSAIVGTLGLAAGWHTLSYSLLNVFPPIAIFTAVASVVTGFLTIDKSIKQKEAIVDEVIKQAYMQIILLVENEKIQTLDGLTLRNYLHKTSESIVNNSIVEMNKLRMTKLGNNEYLELYSAFQSHLNLLEQARDELG